MIALVVVLAILGLLALGFAGGVFFVLNSISTGRR